MIKRIYFIVTEVGRPFALRLTGVVMLAIAILCVWLAGFVGMLVAPFIVFCAGGGMFLVLHADDLDAKQEQRHNSIAKIEGKPREWKK